MVLQTSGTITENQIHVEAGGSSGTTVGMNDADVRSMIDKASGASNAFSEYYGASSYLSYTLGGTAAASQVAKITFLIDNQWNNNSTSCTVTDGMHGRSAFSFSVSGANPNSGSWCNYCDASSYGVVQSLRSGLEGNSDWNNDWNYHSAHTFFSQSIWLNYTTAQPITLTLGSRYVCTYNDNANTARNYIGITWYSSGCGDANKIKPQRASPVQQGSPATVITPTINGSVQSSYTAPSSASADTIGAGLVSNYSAIIGYNSSTNKLTVDASSASFSVSNAGSFSIS